MRGMLVALAAILVACGDAGSPKSGFEASYSLSGCANNDYPPCHAYGSAGTQTYVDSSTIQFNRDRTVTWLRWETTSSNPCYIYGTSCLTTGKPLVTVVGTYEVRNDSIVVSGSGAPGQGHAFAASTVTSVPKSLSTLLTPGMTYSLAIFSR